MVTTPPGFGHRRLVDDLLRSAGGLAAAAFESQDLATVEGLVSAGLGVAVTPEAMAGTTGSVAVFLTGIATGRSIGLAWRSDESFPRRPSSSARW